MRGCGLSRHADVERWCVRSGSSWEGLHCVIYTFFFFKSKQITLEASALDFTLSPARSSFRGVKARWQEVVL